VAKHRHLVFDKLESVTSSKTECQINERRQVLEAKLHIINRVESGEKQSEVAQKKYYRIQLSQQL
jgi:hypothetical protein